MGISPAYGAWGFVKKKNSSIVGFINGTSTISITENGIDCPATEVYWSNGTVKVELYEELEEIESTIHFDTQNHEPRMNALDKGFKSYGNSSNPYQMGTNEWYNWNTGWEIAARLSTKLGLDQKTKV